MKGSRTAWLLFGLRVIWSAGFKASGLEGFGFSVLRGRHDTSLPAKWRVAAQLLPVYQNYQQCCSDWRSVSVDWSGSLGIVAMVPYLSDLC